MKQDCCLPRSTGDYVRLWVNEQVSLLELNDSSHFNALSIEMASDVHAAIKYITTLALGANQAVVVQGAGEHFCPGGNMYRKGAPSTSLLAAARASIDLFAGFCRLRTLPMLAACAAHGTVVGGGLAACLGGSSSATAGPSAGRCTVPLGTPEP